MVKSKYIKLTDGNVVFWIEKEYWLDIVNPFQLALPAKIPTAGNTLRACAFLEDPARVGIFAQQYVYVDIVRGVQSVYDYESFFGSQAIIKCDGREIGHLVNLSFNARTNGCTCGDIKSAFNYDFKACDFCKRELEEERRKREKA